MRKSSLTVHGRDRLIFEALRLMNGDKNASRVGRKTDLSGSTIRNMRREPKRGGTMYPRALTLAKIAQAYGYELKFVPHGNSSTRFVRHHEELRERAYG